MSPATREVSDFPRDDIVLPYAVESLSTRGRLVRLGPAIELGPEALRLPRPGQ